MGKPQCAGEMRNRSFNSTDVLPEGSKSIDSAPGSSVLSVESSEGADSKLRFSIVSDDTPPQSDLAVDDAPQRARSKSVKQQFPIGARVEIHSLLKRHELNGQKALIKDNTARWRDGQVCAVVVFCETEEKLKVKFTNMKRVVTSPTSEPAPAPAVDKVPSTDRLADAALEERSTFPVEGGPTAEDCVTPPVPEERPVLSGATCTQSFRQVARVLDAQRLYCQDDVRREGVRGTLFLLGINKSATMWCGSLTAWPPPST